MKQLINSNWEFLLNGERVWRKIDLPHDWAIDLPFKKDMPQAGAQGFRDRFSKGKYRKELNIEKSKGYTNYYLHFDGVFEKSTITVNGKYAGGKKYGYSPFDVEISNLINDGKNIIELEVDNTQNPVDRWYSGCGIYRNVYLVFLPEKYIDRNKVVIMYKDDFIYIKTGIADSVRVEADIEGELYTADGNNLIKLKIGKHKKWSAANPQLYRVKLILLENGYIEEFKVGFRNIEISPKGFFVNGKSEKLKGVCVHQDAAMFGMAVPAEIWRDRLLKLKQIGCNAMRPSHHMFAPEFMDLCDELGFYVYEECFDKWISGSYGRFYETEWQTDLTAMIERDRNRPSVIIWGMGNEVEFQGQEEMLERLRSHTKLAHELDATRPVSYAMNPHFKRRQRVNVKDIEDIQAFVDEVDEYEIFEPDEKLKMIKGIADIVDIIGCNYQENWYELIHQNIPDKAILGTEIHQYKTDVCEQLNAYTDKIPWLHVEDKDYVIGGMIWTGIDYLGESVVWPAKGWSGALFYPDMTPRASAYIMKSYWSDEPFVKFFVLDNSFRDEGVKEAWDIPRYVSHWHFPQVYRSLIPVMTVSNCDRVEIRINGKLMLNAYPSEYKNRLVEAILPYEKGTVEIIGYKNGKKVVLEIVKTPESASQLVFDNELVEINPGEHKILKVTAADKDGNPLVHENANIRFATMGNVEVFGVANGDIMSFEPYRHNEIHMYRGSAVVAIKVKEGGGKVHAFADGMLSAECIIK